MITHIKPTRNLCSYKIIKLISRKYIHIYTYIYIYVHHCNEYCMSKDKRKRRMNVWCSVNLFYIQREEHVSLGSEYGVPFFIDIYGKDTVRVRAAWSFSVKGRKIGLICRQIPWHKVIHLDRYFQHSLFLCI